MCLVPAEAKSGDWICAFLRLRAPFIIHRHREDYNLVGDCYVQGLMKGEVLGKV
jgi:hypothetical protein